MTGFDLVSMTGYRVRFESSNLDEEIENLKIKAGAYLPAVIFEEIGSIEPNFTVQFFENQSRSFEQSERKVVIKDIWKGKISLDLWHMLYSVIRKEMISKGLYPVHAACAGKEKQVLLVGHTGAGKTTIMMKLIKDLGWKIFSGNKTVVDLRDGVSGVGATKTISIRESAGNKYSALQLDDQHFDERLVVPIAAICIVKLDPSADRTVENGYPEYIHSLYPYFVDSVYADTIMSDGKGIYDGTVELKYRLELIENLKKQLQNIKVFSMAGSLSYLTNELAKLV